jgi:predicted MFS family arabinose efflux permease
MITARIGLAMVAGTLITIVLAKIPVRHSDAASSLINSAIQVGAASGVALVGTIYFGQLGTRPPVYAATAGLLTVIRLYLLAAALAFVLPPGRVTVDHGPAESAAVTSTDPATGPAVEVN